jgi:hypothetical protein
MRREFRRGVLRKLGSRNIPPNSLTFPNPRKNFKHPHQTHRNHTRLMEFPGLGTHCAEPSCHQLDFLPYICPFCPPLEEQATDGLFKPHEKNLATTTVIRAGKRYRVFCGEHRLEHSNCPGRRNIIVPTALCPLCATVLPIANTMDSSDSLSSPSEAEINSTVERHLLAGCKSSAVRCAVAKCKQKPIAALSCKSCSKKLCGSHRYPDTHECVVPRKGISAGQAAAAARKPMTVR